MLRKCRGDIEWLEFELLQPYRGLRHAVFLKSGSYDFYLSGEDPLVAQKNLEVAREMMGWSAFCSLKQVHGNVSHEIEAPIPLDTEGDALITSQKGLALMVKHADCQGAILYDPKREKLATVHCGWRGSVCNIYKEIIERMGSDPHDLLVCIGPSLGPQSAEFIHYQTELPKGFWKYQPTPNHFDFWEISRSQLREVGVRDHHIECAEVDTMTQDADCFSYRREKNTKRHGTIAFLL